jgi:hypothetical protein
MGQHSVEAEPGLRHQIVQTGGPGMAHRVHDAPPGGHDLHIAGPGDPHLKLVGAVPGPHEVGVRIHETGHHGPADSIKVLSGAYRSLQFGGWANRHYPSIANGYRSAGDKPQIAHGRTSLRTAWRGQGQELSGIVDQQIGVGGHGSWL